MALPISGTGFQYGSGNISEVELYYTDSPSAAITATGNVPVYDLTMGIVVVTPAAPVTLTLPTATQIETILQGRAGLTFDTSFVNSGASTITVAVNTGITVIGSLITVAATSAHYRFRKTADGAWVAYRMA
jgi:hypothetical protein